MLKAEKEKIVQELIDKFQRAQGIYLADFTGLDVASITELRRKLMSASVELRVVKNTLARLAVEGAGIPELRDSFEGPTCLALGYEDPAVPARLLVDFAKDRNLPKIRSGLLEGKLLSESEISDVANLPSKEELLRKVVTLARNPLVAFVSRWQGFLQKFVATVDALRIEKEKESDIQKEEDTQAADDTQEESGIRTADDAQEESGAQKANDTQGESGTQKEDDVLKEDSARDEDDIKEREDVQKGDDTREEEMRKEDDDRGKSESQSD